MVKKLRKKFLLIVMLSLLTVLTAVMTTINTFNYTSILNEADRTLDYIATNDGKFPDTPPEPPEEDNPEDEEGDGLFPDEDEEDKENEPLESPEAPFETRYFTVRFHADGEITLDLSSIAAVDENQAVALAEEAIESERRYGTFDHYRFKVERSEEGILVIFLDCMTELFTFRTFVLVSISVSGIGLVAIFILVFLLSDRIIKPFIDSYEKQKRFITDAGHDIKTPITVIEADAELIALEHPDNEWAQDIKKQTRRLATLTSDLVYLARMEEGVAHKKCELNISEIVTDEAGSYAALSCSACKEFRQSIAPSLNIQANEGDIRRLVGILLDNAFKYSGDDGRIELSLSRTSRHVVFEVTNTAKNLSEESVSHLFERFWRADSARGTKGGFGIGLSMAEAIVSAHSGKISAKFHNEELTISVTLPLQ